MAASQAECLRHQHHGLGRQGIGHGVRGGGGFGRGLRGGGQLFGNGTRFVWQQASAQELQVAEAALVDAVEAGFVAMQQRKAAGIVGILEGCGQAAGSVTGIRVVEAFVEELRFDGPGPAHAPPSRHHLLNDAKLDAVGRLEAFEVIGEDFREALGRFILQDYDAGE
jgi:hypothetical protein